METRDLTTKLMAKTPKIVRNCEGWVSKTHLPINPCLRERAAGRGSMQFELTSVFSGFPDFTSALDGGSRDR
jgi:hypothetical protein